MQYGAVLFARVPATALGSPQDAMPQDYRRPPRQALHLSRLALPLRSRGHCFLFGLRIAFRRKRIDPNFPLSHSPFDHRLPVRLYTVYWIYHQSHIRSAQSKNPPAEIERASLFKGRQSCHFVGRAFSCPIYIESTDGAIYNSFCRLSFLITFFSLFATERHQWTHSRRRSSRSWRTLRRPPPTPRARPLSSSPRGALLRF